MSEEVNEGYTVSFKTDESYSAALIVVRGRDDRALDANLDRLNEDLVQKIVETRQLVLAANNAAAGLGATATGQAAQQQSQTQTAVQANAAGDPNVKTCAHGVRTYKTGNNSRGKWEGWMCPQPKNASDKCDPIWG